MKRLSKITESIWSDIQDRSMGKTVRKEDDINLMSGEDFCDYLNYNYICKDGYKTYRIYYVSKALHITALKKFINVSYNIKYDYKTNMIYLNDDIEDFVPELCKKIKENFKVVKKRVGDSYTKFIIYPSDGSECTNRFFVDVINFIIDNADENVLLLKKKHINESIWSDIQDRSMGKTRRKEDDIDLLDETGLVNYMKKVYMPPSPNDDLQIIGGEVNSGTIIASLFKTNEGHYNIIYQKMSESNPEITFPVCPDSGIEELLKEHYTVISIPRYNNKIYYIKPKDGSKITNKFFLEIIDFILDVIKDDDNIYQVIFKKKHINESIWSDIQDRSMGKIKRKEDVIITNEELKNRIQKLYKEQGEGETLDVSSLTNFICDDFSNIFRGFKKVKHIIGLEDWDVSNVENMHGMFRGCENFNADLSKWDVSSVEDMGFMFYNCTTFNSDLSKWNVSSVEDMGCMFKGCENFNSNLSNWDVSSVDNMINMFNGCKKFNSDLSNWYVSKVIIMYHMFEECEKFNCDLSNWDVSSVKDMGFMFYNCKKFNCDLSNWNVSSVNYMNSMFWGCENFNSNLSKWNVSNVKTMYDMFDGCNSLKNKPSWYKN